MCTGPTPTVERYGKYPKAGGASVVLATGHNAPSALNVDGTDVYWVNLNSYEVWKVPLAGGTAELTATGQSDPTDMVLRASLQNPLAVLDCGAWRRGASS